MATQRTEQELAAETLAARLDHALEALGIKLRYGRPTVSGSERFATLRVGLHLDAVDGARDLRRLISILETSHPRGTDTNELAARMRQTITQQILSSREGLTFCTSLDDEQRAALDDLIQGPLAGNVAQAAITLVTDLQLAASTEVH